MSLGMIRNVRKSAPRIAAVLLPAAALAFLWPVMHARAQDSPQLGTFEGQSDVGTVLHAGTGEFDSASKTYTVTGSGANIWSNSDDFHFVWKKISAQDLTLTADIALLGDDGDPHRKAVLMVRQSLDSDSAYADAAIHGDGLASMQFRIAKGSPTHEVQANVSGPKQLRLEKVGDRFFLWIAPDGHTLQFAGGSIHIPLQSPFYVGIGVCAHNKDAVLKASFLDVELSTTLPVSAGAVNYSTIQTVKVASTDSRAIYVSHDHIEAPSWGSDPNTILFRSDDKNYQIAVTGGPSQVTQTELPENFGQERAPDGRYVYMSSNRTGTLQIWRQNPDGTDPEQMTHDSANDTNPRLSPDGKYIAYVSYPARMMSLPDNTDLSIRVLSLTDNTVRTMGQILGGRESLGAQPWSPDSTQLTFASYQSFP